MCECVTRIDQLLKPHNTKLALTITFGAKCEAYPTIQTEQVEKGRGKAKAQAMLPTFCPFCGDKYEAAAHGGKEG
jgi:hypothetical protein